MAALLVRIEVGSPFKEGSRGKHGESLDHYVFLIGRERSSLAEQCTSYSYTIQLKVLGKSVGLCKTTKRNDELYISLLVSVYAWRIFCENFKPNGLILAEI